MNKQPMYIVSRIVDALLSASSSISLREKKKWRGGGRNWDRP